MILRNCHDYLFWNLVIFFLLTSKVTGIEDDDLNLEDFNESEIPVIEGVGEPVTIAEENDVLILTNQNFHHVVGTKEVMLVEFYAPWCGHCKSLEPEYASAAKELKKDGIRIGKVDATTEENLAKEFGISGYPSIKFFKKGQFVEDFDGLRTSTGIIQYMKIRADPDYKPPPSAVEVLTADNFSSFINSQKLSLVEFYAPWCGHCKRLAPEYEGAAQDLLGDEIPLAKVDATVETTLAKEYEVRGYPKLLLFRNERSFEFKGPRDRSGIVRYMRDQAKLPSTLVRTPSEAKNRIPRADSYVFAYFEEEKEFYREYIAAANEMRDESIFLHTFDSDVADKFGLESNSVNVIFPEIYHSKYEDSKLTYKKVSGSQAEIVSWVTASVVPLVGERTKSNSVKRYSKRPLLVVYCDVSFAHQHVVATQIIRNKILPIAKKHRDIVFAMSDEEHFEDELKSFGLDDSGEDINVAIFGENDQKYRMEPDEDFDSEELEEFVSKFKKGKLKVHLRSQPVPKRQEGPVRIIVAKTFEKEVLDTSRDVLIEFYAPWCGHCKKLDPVYKKVAKHFAKEHPQLVVAKMDATANDVHPKFSVQGFPTIFLVKGNDKEHPVSFPGNERTFNAFKEFIEEHLDSDTSKDEL